MTVTPERDNMLTVRLNRDERNMVKALATLDGVSLSDAVRMCVRRAHAERLGDTKRPGKR